MPIVITGQRFPYYKVILDDNPIAYWRLGDTGGGSPLVAIDETGTYDGNYKPYTGTIALGQPGLVPGNDTAVQLSGDHNGIYFDHPQTDALAIITMEAWIKPDDLTNEQVIWKEGGFTNGVGMCIYDSQFVVGFSASSSVTNIAFSTAGFSTGQIIHLVGVIDDTNDNLRLYVNGILRAEDTEGTVSSHDGENDARIGTGYNLLNGVTENPATGNSGGDYAFNYSGIIDEVAIYDYELTPAQITKHYNAGT